MPESILDKSNNAIINSVDQSKIRILIIDYDGFLLKGLKCYLETQGTFDVEAANSLKEAKKRLAITTFDLIIYDYEMPNGNRLEFLENLRKKITIPIILVTKKDNAKIDVKALNLGIFQLINKQDDSKLFFVKLSSLIQQAAQETRQKLALKENEERFRQVAENSKVWVWEVNSNGLYTYSNATVEDILGYRPEEIVGKKFFYDFLPKNQESKKAISSIFSQKQAFHDFISRKNHKNGKQVWISTSGLPKLDANGDILGFRGTDVNISGHKEAEDKLAESEEKYRDIFENVRDAIYVHDLKGKISSINNVVTEYGYTKEQLIGKNLLNFVPKRYWPRLIAQFSQVARGNRIEGEIEVNIPLGSRIAEYRSNPILRDGKVIGAHAVLRDITERKKIETALVENQQKFHALFSANPDASVFLDDTFHVIEINSRFSKLFGYSNDETEGKLIDLIVPKEAQEESKSIRQKILSGPVELVTSRRRKNGSQIPVMMSGGPVVVNKKTIGAVLVYKDISAIVTAQEELSKALIKAELLNEKLSIVGGFTRHDVRNKLTVINGNLYLAKKSLKDNAQLCVYLDQIKVAVSNIDHILDFSKDFEMLGNQELISVDVGKAVDCAALLFADLKGVRIINECHGFNILADSMLTTIFYNLIDNSLKYGQKITQIRIFNASEQNSKKIFYEDNGVGIDEQIKKQIFVKGIGKGTGYGLYLIKRTCEIYGWTLQETGQPGKGVHFEFIAFNK